VSAEWHPSIDEIADEQAGLSPDDDGRTIAAHLAECSACRQTAAALSEVSGLLAEEGARPEPIPTDVAASLDAALASAASERSAERDAGVPSLAARRADREGATAAAGSGSGGARRTGRWVFGAAAAVAVFALGAAVVDNGLPGSSGDSDSASSAEDQANPAAGDAAGGQAGSNQAPRATQQSGDNALLSGARPKLDAHNVDGYAARLAKERTQNYDLKGTRCGALQSVNTAGEPATVDSVVTYEGTKALLRVDRDTRRLTVLSCPGPTKVLYTSSY
jgi:hypothetical protein